MERFSVELAKMPKFSYGSIPYIKSKIPFLFHLHSIPLPNPFDNIIVLPNLSIPIPFRFHSNPTNFTSTGGVHFYSIPLPFHFHSISFLFFMNFFFVKGPFYFHSNSIPFHQNLTPDNFNLFSITFPFLFHSDSIPLFNLNSS